MKKALEYVEKGKAFPKQIQTQPLCVQKMTICEEFSGTCSYLTEFEKPKTERRLFTLDLGRMDYSAEVFVNERPVGVLIMPPYRLTLPTDILKDENTLEIRVTGSVANEYKYTKAFEMFAKWQLSPYHDKQMKFCEDNLSAGLFGPVKICF